ncbi:hypothetical protein C8A01DRAFT_39953 [Parachaetomium inaequale]|uniref:Uncharacterized protein n=1 Tax=Parachaetomium inaequale TaxID=2588326 RepID=A0AAN6SMY0_9PEZI|nr:hypothetical protein C8A01DRAFT_39953 [Parachaetomium inaequale]
MRLAVAEVGDDDTPEAYTDTITVAEGDTIDTAYVDLLQPLKQLTAEPNAGLARFYADLPYPWQWTDESMMGRRGENGQAWLQHRKRAVKRSAERRVLGDDRYEKQYANGKEEPEQSLWQHVFYHHS